MKKVIPLENGAVEVKNFDVQNFDQNDAKELLDILRKELVVVIRNQDTDPLNYARLVHYLGGICNWDQLRRDINGVELGKLSKYPDVLNWDKSKPFPVQRVTGEKIAGQFSGLFPLGKLDWHCNLNGQTRADGVALQGIKGVVGTQTSWLNTALALKEMPLKLRKKVRGKFATFHYNPIKWSDLHNEEQREFMLRPQEPYKMWVEQTNIGGQKGLYLYTHNDCKIDGDEDGSLFNELQDFVFQEKFMYNHDWDIGDIVLSDQLLTLHKRRQEEDAIFEKRVLNRITFRITNIGNPPALVGLNKID